MAPFCLNHIALVGKVGVEECRSRGSIGARRVDARGGPVSPRDHGELIGPGRGSVVEVVRGRAGLERAALGLRGARVRRREIGVVSRGRGHGRHTDPDPRTDGRRRVGERSRVVHPRVGNGRERGEGAVDPHPGVTECRQVGSTWSAGKEGRELLSWQSRGSPFQGNNQHLNPVLQLAKAVLLGTEQSCPSPRL